ncbi:GNAT family N-acetyltransferase [Hyphomicrobium sp. CS1BSMeth3]|uniref:GNAT family N-acetyltransferase n=1 Tax=Hyphomicrobium sp. CS1BSMeth3 TaxID=1892844 RepID=UPI0009310975|nr:GNAT family N-acetyltransferase [Hyphomicrobium sp. CS1BSMeth3]
MAPVLETERLRLRSWRGDDLDTFATFMADGAETRFIGGPLTREDTWRRIAMFIGHWALRGFGNWVIEEKASGVLAGYSGLWEPEGWQHRELMWGLLPAFRGRGYATEAAARARAYAYGELGWPTIVSYIAPENAPSRGVAERLGAKQDGSIEMRGAVVDVWRHPANVT